MSGLNPLAGTDYAFLFESRHNNSLGSWFTFTFVWGYMGGVNGLAGHELIHKTDPANKMIGMFTFTKMLYSHFLLEHSNGHHRNIATPEDSATARKNENFYSFMVRSVVGGHLNTFNREVDRINMEHEEFGDGGQPGLVNHVLKNRMTWFTLIHITLLIAIYSVFGWHAVLF